MAEITLLDGGMGQELVARSGDDPTPLWATRVMLDHPHLVRAIHDDYFAAGATVATTNTYAIHHDRLEGFGLDHLFSDLHRNAVAEAVAARAAHGSGRIAGSMGPLIATYRADVTLPVAEALIGAVHLDAGADRHVVDRDARVDGEHGVAGYDRDGPAGVDHRCAGARAGPRAAGR